MTEIVWNISAFVLAIALLVTFHEWGHFLVARWFKIDVLRFSIGFGKRLWSWQGRKGTQYVIAAVPLGGYVKMLDEREGPVPSERVAYAFNRQTVAKRLAVVVAGPAFNLLFAFLAYWLMLVGGVEHPKPIVGTIEPHSVAARAGLKTGDEIIAINDDVVDSWRGVVEKLILHANSEKALRVDVHTRHQQTKQHVLNTTDASFLDGRRHPVRQLGIIPYKPSIEARISAVSEEGAAALAGLKSGDVLLMVNATRIENWQSFVDTVRASANKPLILDVQRRDKQLRVTLTPQARTEGDTSIGFVGIVPTVAPWPADKLRTTRYNAWAGVGPALTKTGEMCQLTGVLLYKLVTGFVSASNISGPIGIAQGAGASASGGLSQYLSFLALVSISLALLNLLPIPVLDGGHILYYVIEAVKGSPVSEKAQTIGFKLGLLFIVGLMTLAFYNDVSRLLH